MMFLCLVDFLRHENNVGLMVLRQMTFIGQRELI
jgi:hypothetical protein